MVVRDVTVGETRAGNLLLEAVHVRDEVVVADGFDIRVGVDEVFVKDLSERRDSFVECDGSPACGVRVKDGVEVGHGSPGV